jgi:hypothetical protein
VGSADLESPISIITLNTEKNSATGKIAVSSRYERYRTSNVDHISWSATGVDMDQDWVALGQGSLFVHFAISSSVDPFRPDISEDRDDVADIGRNAFEYVNGIVLGKNDHRGVYHVIFPPFYFPTSIDYLARGDIRMIHARVMGYRPIMTWAFNERLQLRIRMKERRMRTPMNVSRTHERNRLYAIAVKNLGDAPKDSETVREIKKNAVQKSFEFVPRLISYFFN